MCEPGVTGFYGLGSEEIKQRLCGRDNYIDCQAGSTVCACEALFSGRANARRATRKMAP